MLQTALILASKPVPGKPELSFLTLSNGKQIISNTAECTGNHVVTYEEHKKGDTYVATRDSKRNHTDGENKGEPLYLKGETVTRLSDFTEVKGFTSIEVYKALKATA